MRATILLACVVLVGCKEKAGTRSVAPERAADSKTETANVPAAAWVVPGRADVSAAAEHKAVVEEPSGKIALFTGKNIGDAIRARGVDETLKEKRPFARIRVPATIYRSAMEKPSRILTLSMEDVANDVEVTVRAPARTGKIGDVEDRVFKAGDPWISGVVQIVGTDDGVSAGFYSIIEHHPPIGQSGEIAASRYQTVIVEDSAMPQLHFATGDTRRWPARPSSWH